MKNNIFKAIIIFNLFLLVFSCKKAEKDPVPGNYNGTVEKGSSDYAFSSLPSSLSSAKIEILDISGSSTAAERGLSGYKYELIITNTATNKRFLYNIGVSKSGNNLTSSFQSKVKSDYSFSDYGFKAEGVIDNGSLTLKLLSENRENGALEEFYTSKSKK